MKRILIPLFVVLGGVFVLMFTAALDENTIFHDQQEKTFVKMIKYPLPNPTHQLKTFDKPLLSERDTYQDPRWISELKD